MIEILGVELDALPSAFELTSLMDEKFLSAHRARHGLMRNERAARASLAGLLLLQSTGVRGDLIYNENGRPSLLGESCDFNITHTDAHTFCAVARPSAASEPCRLGLDAENLSRLSHERVDRLAERWFSDAENASFAADPTPEAFLRIWTRKEALLKWIGTGLVDLPHADTVCAEAFYNVRFVEYRMGDTLITLCLAADAVAPQEIRMLSAETF
ncbi:MAG: 4'-phosphopantetheinyl transferase superfamily protein [Clostridia bacterium]|nr:4'-phosphopantetheinyl transferase superfamily protein [Clostridia bacterium]